MWLIVKSKKEAYIRYFKRKSIRYYIFLLICKIKKKEVDKIDEKETYGTTIR